MEKEFIRAKKKSRKLALQALYQWQLSGTSLHEIEAQFWGANKMEKSDSAYFHTLLFEIAGNVGKIDDYFLPFLDRKIGDLRPIELAILRLGTFELVSCPELPYKVVLDEAISLTKAFGAQDGYKYVNGVLNKVAHQVRVVEIGFG